MDGGAGGMVRPFLTTRPGVSDRGNMSIFVEDAPDSLSIPASWICERLQLDQLLVGQQVSDDTYGGHILTNAPADLVRLAVRERWFQTDEYWAFWRSRPGWTMPTDLLAWVETNPTAKAKLQSRLKFGLPVQTAFTFDCEGMRGHIAVARHRPIEPDEMEIVEFVGPCLFSAFVQYARKRMTVSITAREREVIRLTSRGLSSHQIARVLGVSEHTIATHIRQAQHKLGTRNRIHLVTEAIRHGLIGPYGASELHAEPSGRQ